MSLLNYSIDLKLFFPSPNLTALCTLELVRLIGLVFDLNLQSMISYVQEKCESVRGQMSVKNCYFMNMLIHSINLEILH